MALLVDLALKGLTVTASSRSGLVRAEAVKSRNWRRGIRLRNQGRIVELAR